MKRSLVSALLALACVAAVRAVETTAPPPRPAAGCLDCHGDQQTALVLKSVHEPGVAPCESCHVVSGRHPADGALSITMFGADSHVPVAEQNGICLGCHAGAAQDWHGGAHATADVGCADCHEIHAVLDPARQSAAQTGRCLGCHLKQRADVLKPYAHPAREGKMSCTACHAAHGSPTEFELLRPTLNETCYDCHAEKRGPFLFEHPPVAEDCSLCHASHGSAHPALLTRRQPLLCQQCHSQAGHPSLADSPAGLPGGRPSPFLLAGSCLNCHAQVHGSNHPSGITLMR